MNNNSQPILVIDDNPVNLKLIQVVLAKNGYQVLTAINATEALTLLQTVHPFLILMDIQLPGMDGLTLTRKIKAAPLTRDIPIIALTAYAMKGDEQKTRMAGCDGYISKPIEVDTFFDTITRIMKQKSQQPVKSHVQKEHNQT